MIINQNNQVERPIHERSFEERKRFGDKAEDGIFQYLKAKYGESNITYRQKEKDVDYKLPDFVVKTEKGIVEVEVKNTSKVKYRDFVHQLLYSINDNVDISYCFVRQITEKFITFRPIKIRDVWGYRLLDKDGIYEGKQDPIKKPFFFIDPKKLLPHQKKIVLYQHFFDPLKPTS